MRYIYTILVIFSISIANSQIVGNKLELYELFAPGTSPKYDSTAAREYRFAGIEENLYPFDSLLYFDNADSVKSFVKNRRADGPNDLDKINFRDSALILVEYQGTDCHAGFIISLIDEMDIQRFLFDVKVMYGGCRAAGMRFVKWFVIPKLPEGYSITYHTYVEYERDYKDK